MNETEMSALLGLKLQLESLCSILESAAHSGVSEIARWNSYEAFAAEYNFIAQAYTEITKLGASSFQMDKMPNSNDVSWHTHKQIFDSIHINAKSLLSRMNRFQPPVPHVDFEDILYPLIATSSLNHYRNRDFRNSVLDGALALSDKIRERTGLDLDGDDLCNNAFSPNNPILVFSENASQSGRNDQKGFLEIFKGFYRGIRNPKAHSMLHDLDAHKTAQYLVLASLLMRRVTEASKVQKA